MRQIILPVVVLAIAVVLPHFLKKNYCECALRGALLVAAGVIGAGCYIHRSVVWEKECKELLCAQQLHVCGTLIRKEQKDERWQLTLVLPGYENRVVVSSEDGGYPLDCVLSVKGPVREFNSPRCEGQFNEKQYYKNRKIIGRMSAEEMVCIRAPSGIYAWKEALFLFRMRLCAVYGAALPVQEAGILSAMAVGQKALLDGDVRMLFQRAGISHILAISGVKTLKLGIPLVPETRINWAFVPLHIAIIYILKLCLDEEIIPRCRFPCSRGYLTNYINWQKKQ